MANYSSTNTGANIDSAVNQIIDSSTDLNVDSNTLVVDKSANNVGIGVTAPGSIANGLSLTPDLEIRGAAGSGAACAGVLALTTAETSTVDGDIQGAIVFQSPIDASGTDAVLSGAAIWAEADATFSSSVNNTELVFATNSSAAATERMRIDSGGNVGIGTAAPGAGLHVDADPGLRISSGSNLWTLSVNSGNGNLYFNDGDANAGIWEDGGSGNFTITGNMVDASDGTLKKSVSTISGGLDKINALRGVTYKWNAESGRTDTDSLHYGVIAQEVESVVPELVSRIENEDGSIIIGVKYARMVSILIEAVKELSTRVATLEG